MFSSFRIAVVFFLSFFLFKNRDALDLLNTVTHFPLIFNRLSAAYTTDIPWSCQPIACNGPVCITTSPTGADSGCSIATGVIVPREVVDSRGLASRSSVPCGSRSSIRCVSARSSITASHPLVAFGRQLSSSSFGHRGVGAQARLKLQDVPPGRIPPCPTYRICVQVRVLARIPAFFIFLILLRY